MTDPFAKSLPVAEVYEYRDERQDEGVLLFHLAALERLDPLSQSIVVGLLDHAMKQPSPVKDLQKSIGLSRYNLSVVVYEGG